ncbi:MAG: type VI secretion system protein TssA [Acidobacteria bacterium]|nr:type VI secretion system protein TssA [Acidobacteriota bacterium]
MSEDKASWRATGAAPITAENPGGLSARYEPEYERLQAEMQKLESLSGGPVDWNQVVSLSGEILRNKSKDLLVGGYLTLGLLETEGLGGLSGGLACLEGMISGHWESLFPEAKRMRARINALNWLSGKAGSAVSRREPGPEDREVLSACGETIRSLETLLEEKANPEEPVFGDLYRPIQEQLSRIPAAKAGAGEAAHKPPVEAAAEPPPAPAVAAAETPGKVETREDAKRALKDAFASLKKAASFLRNQDLTQPMPYRLIRFAAWSDLEAPPPAENGKSRVPPPPGQLRDRFRKLGEQSAWKELVTQVESKVTEFPFWLDLHRMCDTALAALGPEYSRARNALKSEAATLLERLPGLEGIEFSDGTPFADESTRNWISTRLFPENAGQGVQESAPGAEDDFLSEVRTRSRQLLLDGDAKAALGLVQESAHAAATGRRRFLARMELASLCIETGNSKAALAHLEMLDEQVIRYSLDVWEPLMASQVLQLYFRTLNKTLRETKNPDPELSRRADSVYGRLCRLDVLAGLNAIK